jgi:hypothetical protein
MGYPLQVTDRGWQQETQQIVVFFAYKHLATVKGAIDGRR